MTTPYPTSTEEPYASVSTNSYGTSFIFLFPWNSNDNKGMLDVNIVLFNPNQFAVNVSISYAEVITGGSIIKYTYASMGSMNKTKVFY